MYSYTVTFLWIQTNIRFLTNSLYHCKHMVKCGYQVSTVFTLSHTTCYTPSHHMLRPNSLFQQLHQVQQRTQQQQPQVGYHVNSSQLNPPPHWGQAHGWIAVTGSRYRGTATTSIYSCAWLGVRHMGLRGQSPGRGLGRASLGIRGNPRPPFD